MVYILIFVIIIFIVAFIYFQKRKVNNNVMYKIKKANSYSILKNKKREKSVFELVKLLNFERFIKKIWKDTIFFRALSFYDIESRIDVSLLMSFEKKKEEDNISREEFKKYLGSQNSILRMKAASKIREFSDLSVFIKERFIVEENEDVMILFLENESLMFDVEILVEKLININSKKLASLIFFRLKNSRSLIKYEKKISRIKNTQFRILAQSMLYPENFMENLLEYMEKEEDDDLFTYINTFVSGVEHKDSRMFQRIIDITERHVEKIYDSKFENKANLELNNIKDVYRLLFYFVSYDMITRYFLINKVLSFNNEKLLGALVSVLGDSQDKELEVFLFDLLYNNKSFYIKKLTLQTLNELDADIGLRLAEYIISLKDEELNYTLIPLLYKSKNKACINILKYFLKNGSAYIKQRVLKVMDKQ